MQPVANSLSRSRLNHDLAAVATLLTPGYCLQTIQACTNLHVEHETDLLLIITILRFILTILIVYLVLVTYLETFRFSRNIGLVNIQNTGACSRAIKRGFMLRTENYLYLFAGI